MDHQPFSAKCKATVLALTVLLLLVVGLVLNNSVSLDNVSPLSTVVSSIHGQFVRNNQQTDDNQTNIVTRRIIPTKYTTKLDKPSPTPIPTTTTTTTRAAQVNSSLHKHSTKLPETTTTTLIPKDGGGVQQFEDVEYTTISRVVPDDNVVRSFYASVSDSFESVSPTVVAVGMGLTTRNTKWTKDKNISSSLPFFKSFLKAFCDTVSEGYSYRIFVAFDYNDDNLQHSEFLDKFGQAFRAFVEKSCHPKSIYSLHFVRCSHTKKPAWAQNDAMIEAYLSGAEYFYRINDDTKMVTKGWTETFIYKLQTMDPSNVGVVGPQHIGGNMRILTYDFTHRTHVEIYGFYYPRDFVDWYADDWITEVYQPGRSVKMTNISLVHTMETGQRYRTHSMKRVVVNNLIKSHRVLLTRYIIAKEATVEADASKVISMSYKDNSAHYWGLVRNAHLAPVIFPGWTLRVYVTNTSLPDKISRTLVRLGAVVKTIPDDIRVSEVSRDCLSYLVADDPDVDVFLIRNADERLSKRDAAAVQGWLSSTDSPDDKFAHVIRDQPSTATNRLVSGQWGAKAKSFRSRLGQSMLSMMQTLVVGDAQSTTCDSLLENLILPKIEDDILCHDSINCEQWSACSPYPHSMTTDTFVGQKYDIYKSIENSSQVKMVITSRKSKCNIG